MSTVCNPSFYHASTVVCFEILSFLKGQKRILKGRQEMLETREADWAMGEAFAFGSLLMEGKKCKA